MSDPTLILGDCIEAMAAMPDASVDAVVTDPPYGLEFMSKDWDRPWAVTAEQPVGYAGREDLTLPTHRDARNANCRTCGGRARGANRCRCETPNWDRHPRADMFAFQQWTEAWATEALRVLKPGGHALVFGGTRTFHRMASGLEDAGFEIRDCLAWMYGSGFPKSLDVSKAIDARVGAAGTYGEPKSARSALNIEGRADAASRNHGWDRPWKDDPEAVERTSRVYEPGSDDARTWQGWGTALKPAFEPIVLARKPLSGTVAANVLAHGVGAMNVDACRVGGEGGTRLAEMTKASDGLVYGGGINAGEYGEVVPGLGRWPANVVLGHHPDCALVGTREVASDGHYPSARKPSAFGARGYDGLEERHTRGETVEEWDCHPECAVRLLDEQTGVLTTNAGADATGRDRITGATSFGGPTSGYVRIGDSGGASRFFYCAKVSRAERNAGLDGFEDVIGKRTQAGGDDTRGRPTPINRNVHPTVKPIDLMRWLIRLVTPPGGVVLDPFLGSGTTGCAAAVDGYCFVGVERDEAYMRIAKARIGFWAEHGEEALDVVRARERADAAREAVAASGQLDLFAEAL